MADMTTQRVRTGRKRRWFGVGSRRQLVGLGFVLPAVILFLIFFAYPLLASLWQSLLDSSGGSETFVGLANYRRLLADPRIYRTLVMEILLLVFQVPIMIVLALALALILNQSWLRFRPGFRTIYFLPAVTTLVAYSIVFRIILTTDGGLVNQILGVFHLGPVSWLDTAVWARVAIIASVIWRWTGYNMVILLAGLQGVPKDLYDAAAVDGATRWKTTTRVVIPQLRPMILFTSVTSTIGALQLFDEDFILTDGGPDNATLTPVVLLYKVGFKQFDFNYASAIAWVLVLFIGIVTFIQFRIMRER